MSLLKFVTFLLITIEYISAVSYLPNCTTINDSEVCQNTDGCTFQSCGEGTADMNVFCSPFTDPVQCQDNGCMWNGCTGNIIWPNNNCFFLNDINACQIVPGCQWNLTSSSCAGIPVKPQSCDQLTNINGCLLFAGCQWNSSCIGELQGLRSCSVLWASSPVCNSYFNCSISCTALGSSTTKPCYQIGNWIDCNSVTSCYWQANSCQGTASEDIQCSLLRSEVCDAFGCPPPTIQTCLPAACGDVASKSICDGRNECMWSQNVCLVGEAGILLFLNIF